MPNLVNFFKKLLKQRGLKTNETIARVLLVGSTLLLLQSCGWQWDTPTIADENAENVKLVLYYSDGDIDWKSYGEMILIDSGELLTVRRDQIRPSEQLLTTNWTDVFLPELEKPFHIGKLPLRLDRKNGIVCNATHCTTLYSICPTWSEMGQGKKKCVSFSHD